MAASEPADRLTRWRAVQLSKFSVAWIDFCPLYSRSGLGERMRNSLVMTMLGIALVGCAGRDPDPIATVQPQDAYSDCTMIRAEIDANNVKMKALADEEGLKVAQNVVTGVGGLFTLGIAWAGMDFKGAASKDAAALDARQKYLTELAVQRCSPGAAPIKQPKR